VNESLRATFEAHRNGSIEMGTMTNLGGNSKYPKRKQRLNSKAIKNITKMVIFSSFLNVLGTAPYTGTYILGNFAISQSDVSRFAIILLYLAPGLNIFIYFFFNKLYQDALKDYLRKIFNHFI
jgi:ABC-type dipeptide/oligopeptide/nickel transport system permease subunit